MEDTIKFNIECGDSPRNGYINTVSNPAVMQRISPELGDDTEITLCEYLKTPDLHKDKEVSEVVFNFYLNVLTHQHIGEFLSQWLNRLCVGGIMKMKFIDIRQVCRLGAFGHLPLSEIHKMILGPEGSRFNIVTDYSSIKDSFNNSDAKIKYSKVDGIEIYLEIEKVKVSDENKD